MSEYGITLGNVLSLIGLLLINIGIVYRAWASNSVKIAKLESDYVAIKERLERDNSRTEKAMNELKVDIKELYNKMDELKDLILTLKH